jgi:hypothetical protein
MLLVGAGAGSLQVMTVSPVRAAGLLLIMTVALPFITVPWLVGGTWNGPPCGMCGGAFVAVLPTTAAGWPRRHGTTRRRDHDDVDVGPHDLVTHLRGRLAHGVRTH